MTYAKRSVIAGNTNTGLLKLIALVFMLIDHAGKMCFPGMTELRLLGRIAFPLYCWCMVVGACHTHSFPRYLGRIALIGLISQPLYMVALNHTIAQFNIFLTLFLALLGLWGLRNKFLLSQIWAPVLALMLAHLLEVDYGWKGVLLVFLLYAVRGSRSGIAAVMISFCLFWGASSSAVYNFFGLSLAPLLSRGTLFGDLLRPFFMLQGMAVLALPLILVRIPGRLKLPGWTSYVLYPSHLVVLIILEYAMGKAVHWHHLADAFSQLIALLPGGI